MKLANFFVKTSVSSFIVRPVRLSQKPCFALNFTQFHRFCLFKIILVSVFLVPSFGHAQVLISEVAWMGTDEDANNEWIELYNLSNTGTDLAGWTLSDGASINVSLTGTLSAHGTGVLERTDDTTLPDTAFLIYSGALSNSGGTLTLTDASGAVSDQAVGGTNWSSIGGSNTVPKKTPQRTRTGTWVTGTPTPNADNVEEDAPATTTEEDDSTTTETTTTSAKTSSGGSSATKKTTPKVVENPVLKLAFNVPNIVYVNQKIELEASPSGIGETLMRSLNYSWNFGDTYTATGRRTSHVFEYPGDYTIVASAEFAKQSAMVRHEVTVLPALLTLTQSPAGDIVIKNDSKYEVDIGGFILEGNSKLTFPKYTFVKPSGTLTIGKSRIGGVSTVVMLYDTQKILIASTATDADTIAPIALIRPKPLSILSREVVSTIPQAQVLSGDEVVQSLETSTKNEPISEPIQGTIQIGNSSVARSEEGGMFTRFFRKLTSLFD